MVRSQVASAGTLVDRPILQFEVLAKPATFLAVDDLAEMASPAPSMEVRLVPWFPVLFPNFLTTEVQLLLWGCLDSDNILQAVDYSSTAA